MIKYECVKCEFKRLGLTNKEVASILDISVQNLDYLIKQDKPRIHWITLGLISYYGEYEMILHKHTQSECKEVLEGIKDIVKQINNINDKELRTSLCVAVLEMCDRLLKDGTKV